MWARFPFAAVGGRKTNNPSRWAVVVAQLAERSLPTPEFRGLNPNIGKVLSTNCRFKKNSKDEKKLGMAH